MNKGKRLEDENLKILVLRILEDVENLKKKTKRIEEDILRQKRARRWV
jgi:hypothetical protein